jgi:hypothetical protein
MKLLTLVVFLAGLASADPVSITWTGTPSISGSTCPACGDPDAEASFTSGTTAIFDAWGPAAHAYACCADSSFDVSNQFTIDAPTLISVTATANYYAYAEACSAIGCTFGITTYDMGAQFQGGLELDDGDNSLWIPLSASGVTQIPCDDGCGTGTVNLSDTASGEVFLDAGTYTVDASMDFYMSAGGDSMTGSGFQAVFTDPVTVPEPSYVGLGFVAIFGCFLFRRFSRWSSKP